MGDGEKASPRLQFNPKVRWHFTVPPSPPMLVFLLFEGLMMPWALPKSLRTTSRKAVPDAISSTTSFRC